MHSVRAEDQQVPTPPAMIRPLSSAKLKELMPTVLVDRPRTMNEGEDGGMLEMTTAKVYAEFGKEADVDHPYIRVEIMDLVDAQRMIPAVTTWMKNRGEPVVGDNRERRMEIAGQPAFETYDEGSGEAEIKIFVAGRFFINARASNVTAVLLKSIGESLPIAKLAEQRLTQVPAGE